MRVLSVHKLHKEFCQYINFTNLKVKFGQGFGRFCCKCKRKGSSKSLMGEGDKAQKSRHNKAKKIKKNRKKESKKNDTFLIFFFILFMLFNYSGKVLFLTYHVKKSIYLLFI